MGARDNVEAAEGGAGDVEAATRASELATDTEDGSREAGAGGQLFDYGCGCLSDGSSRTYGLGIGN